MAEFLNAITQMPTAIFTVLLALVVGYWLLVIAGALDLDLFDADLDLGDASTADSLAALGMRGVPLPVWLSIFLLAAWVFSIGGMRLAATVLGPSPGSAALAAAVGLGASAAALGVTALAVRPLFPLFVAHNAVEHRTLVGKLCTITTLRVDEQFGQALVDDGGAGLLVQVRSEGGGDLTRGERALIFDYNADDGTFNVAKFDDPAVERRQ